MNNKIDNQKNNPLLFTLTIVLGIFSLLILIITIIQKDTKLLVSLLGLVGLIILMNIAQRIYINKEKAKIWSIICLVALVISIPLLIKYVIFSLMLSIPSFILSKKLMKKSNLTLVKISYFGSLLISLLGIAMTIVGFIMAIINSGL